MNLKKTLALLCGCALLGGMAVGCEGDTASSNSADSAASQTDTASKEESALDTNKTDVPQGDPDWVPADESLGLKTLKTNYATDEMIARAVLSEGNTARLAAVMKRAQAGEHVTIATIGGSITQGSSASSSSERYAERVLEWWFTNIPAAQLHFVNAGIGATDSYIGVHRVDEDVIAKDADVIVVEFSVNDTNEMRNLKSYDSLVRKLLQSERQPAVILLFTTQENGTSMQETHRKVGDAYDLPMISYKNAILPEIDAGKFPWTDISPDNIHPNSKGHTIIGEIMWAYFNSVYAKLDEIDTSDLSFDEPAVTDDIYAEAKLLDSTNTEPTAMEGFAKDNGGGFYQFPNSWSTQGGGELTFTLTGKNFGLMYLKTTDGKSGTYEVWMDGEKISTLNGDFSGGWGNYAESNEFFISEESAEHTITIKPAEGSEGKKFSILGLLVS